MKDQNVIYVDFKNLSGRVFTNKEEQKRVYEYSTFLFIPKEPLKANEHKESTTNIVQKENSVTQEIPNNNP